jgi:23S rRNA pseudouridine2605 synthase
MAIPPEPRTGERIAKLLARAGVASRREVERMIAEGRVKIGDVVLTTPATVLENLNGVTVDGTPVKAPEPARLFRFHKPSGLITAERDPAGRPTIYAALTNALPKGTPRLMPVGRLDFNTEGLLLMTNDGIHYGKIDANMERKTGRNQWIEVTLTEGKNREVRRVLEHLGLEVSRLLRTAYGPFLLGDMPRGTANEVPPKDVARFVEAMPSFARSEAQDPASKKPTAPPPKRGSYRPEGPEGKRKASPSRPADGPLSRRDLPGKGLGKGASRGPGRGLGRK